MLFMKSNQPSEIAVRQIVTVQYNKRIRELVPYLFHSSRGSKKHRFVRVRDLDSPSSPISEVPRDDLRVMVKVDDEFAYSMVRTELDAIFKNGLSFDFHHGLRDA